MEDRKHSGVGIAAFILSTISGMLMFLLVAVAGFMEVSTPGGMDEESVGALLIGLGVIGLIGLSTVSLGLGISGLIQKNRKKLFAVIGTVFSITSILGMVLLILIGLTMG